jgi:hypothetical protein
VRTSTSVYLGNYFEANPPYRAAFDWLPSGKFEPSLPGYDSIYELVTEAAAAIVSEPYPDVRSTLEALNQAANEILDAYFH